MKRAILVDIQRSKNENQKATLRRFSRQSKELQLVRKIRSHRYHIRSKSKNVERTHTLSSLARRKQFNTLVKLGKIDLSDTTRRHKK
ncbi:MAG TPA: hypothetical protein ENI56_00595 [Candidatus Kaiserbacteria bacterium]|nr:hypothetical protein [Candidatus Kaiserbacteria bacterium]